MSSAKIGTSSWRYYTNSVACAATEYYLGAGEAPGRWHGRGLARLGLEPDALVNEAQLEALFARALHPGTGERLGTQLDAHNVRRVFRRVVKAAGLEPVEWAPRELRHSFVSLLSDAGVPLENISRLVGHSGSAVTELVYRKQIRPVIADGAEAMDRIFPKPQQPDADTGA